MAHRKRVWHVRIFPVDGHAVPGTLADHACTWAKKKNPPPETENQVAIAYRYRLSRSRACNLQCNGASGHNFLVSTLQFHGTERTIASPIPTRRHPPAPHVSRSNQNLGPRGSRQRASARGPEAPLVHTANPVRGPPLRPLPTPTRVPGRNGPEAGVMRDARCAIYTRQPRQLLALLCSRSHADFFRRLLACLSPLEAPDYVGKGRAA
jgi:hypothetical protein